MRWSGSYSWQDSGGTLTADWSAAAWASEWQRILDAIDGGSSRVFDGRTFTTADRVEIETELRSWTDGLAYGRRENARRSQQGPRT